MDMASVCNFPTVVLPDTRGTWATGILRKTLKKPFLKVFPMPPKNPQKTLKKPSAAPGNFAKRSKNPPAPP